MKPEIPWTLRVPAYAVAGAVFLGMTFASGGVHAEGRLLVGAILFVGAVIVVWQGGGCLRGKAPLFLPLLACLMSLIGADIPGLGFEYVAELAFITLVGAVLSDASRSHLFPASIVAGAVVLSLSVFIESMSNVEMIGIHGLAMGASGLLLGANVTAVALAVSLPCRHSATLQRGNSNAGRVAKLQTDGIAAIILIGLALTGSRTGMIAAAGGMLIPFFQMSARARKQMIFAGVVLVAVGALLYLPRFIDRLDPHYMTNSQRISMMRGVRTGFREKPFLGFGPWSFPVLGQRFLTWPKWELHPHSLPLRILFESGMVGLLLWIAFFGVLIKRAYRSSGAPVPILCAIVFGSLTDDVLWIPGMAAIFFLAAGSMFENVGLQIENRSEERGLRQKSKIFNRLVFIPLLCILFFASSVLPVLYEHRSGLPFEPNSSVIDRAVADRAAPRFMGDENDPTALRLGGYVLFANGETEAALSNFHRAFALDPNMIFGPHLLDMAWTFAACSRDTEAALTLHASARLAPVLTAWYRGDSASASGMIPLPPSPIDWHYGIEFPDPSVITASMVPKSDDIMDWRHYRGLGAEALLRGDTAEARSALTVSLYLAHRQYGTDPVLVRLCALCDIIDSRVLTAQVLKRDKPAYPYAVFAPLYYRHPVHSIGDISSWWIDRPRKSESQSR